MMAERSIPRGRRAGSVRRTLCVLAVLMALVGCELALQRYGYPAMTASAFASGDDLPAWLMTLLPDITAAFTLQTVAAILHGIGILTMLLLWGAWCFHTSHACLPHAQAVKRAVVRYRLTMLLLLAVLAFLSLVLWWIGLRPQAGGRMQTLIFAASPIATLLGGMALFRLCAPGVVSGRHGFFIRL